MTRSSISISLASLVFLGALLLACSNTGNTQLIRIGEHQPRFIIAFLDETGSRRDMWNPMLNKIALIARRLKHQDELTVMGISDRGFNEKDVLIPATLIVQSPNDIVGRKLKQAREEIAERILALRPRTPEPQTTDIVGAIKQAAEMANKEGNQRKVVLAFFSDMQQTPKMPGEREFKNVRFPDGTTGHCFYVTGSPQYDYARTVAIWQHLLSTSGVTITKEDFSQLDYVDIALNHAFPE
jgi:hypothetical protein